MQPIQLSSGDLVADRRAAYAEMLRDEGDHSAAADLMRDALAMVPGWVAGWFRLGEMCEDAGRIAEAADAWREVLRLDATDRLGATLKLSMAGLVEGVDAPPIAFVETLFDQYAGTFDNSLVEKLDYRVPELLSDAILTARDRFAHAVDLGCGTGLLGERLKARASFLEGVDISAGMLKRAEAKRLYDRLSQADLNHFDLPVGIDLVTAADVFMYVGAMPSVVARIAAALPADGMFAFSVELHDGPEELVLRPSRRYAHSEASLRALLADAGFDIVSADRATIRLDVGRPIEGLIVVAVKQGPVAALPILEGDLAVGTLLLH